MTPRKIINSIAGTALVMASVACGRTATDGYELDVRITERKDLPATAALYRLMPEYDKTILVDSVPARGGVYHFTGTVGEAEEAFVRFSGDTAVHYLVLTDNRLEMTVGKDGSRVYGSESNRLYSQLLDSYDAMLAEQDRLQKKYSRLRMDSVLTRHEADSLQVLYKTVSVRWREQTLRTLSQAAADYPVAVRLSLRRMQQYLTVEQTDSLLRVLQKK